jgi:succinoglycan biosynthesis transport protein ExoP
MRDLLAAAGDRYDYVVVDLPPLGPVIDVRAAADLIDAFVFVVEWGKTPRSLVRATIETEGEVMKKCLGIVLNKVDHAKMVLYENSSYRNYYYTKYAKYYAAG